MAEKKLKKEIFNIFPGKEWKTKDSKNLVFVNKSKTEPSVQKLSIF